MRIHQLSVFLENKPHQLRLPAKVLGEAGIDILTMSLADTEQFGIMRLIVDDWEKAQAALSRAGCVVKVTDVVAIEVPDRPGGLAVILERIETADLNVEYMYSCTFHRGDQAVLVFRFEVEFDQVVERLESAGVRPVSRTDLFDGDRR